MFHKNWKFSNNYSKKIQKFLSNRFNFSKFFLEKNRFLGKKNVDMFENSIHFLILCIVLTNETTYDTRSSKNTNIILLGSKCKEKLFSTKQM